LASRNFPAIDGLGPEDFKLLVIWEPIHLRRQAKLLWTVLRFAPFGKVRIIIPSKEPHLVVAVIAAKSFLPTGTSICIAAAFPCHPDPFALGALKISRL
jgi:hypothetical protein